MLRCPPAGRPARPPARLPACLPWVPQPQAWPCASQKCMPLPPWPLCSFPVATIFLAVLSLVDDKHRLRSERLVARESSAKGAVAWLASQAKQVGGLCRLVALSVALSCLQK